MLRRLRVENLVLIGEAELELAPGLNAITGETGAGKTILAQAIGLLLGARGDPALVRPGAAEAYVEAELDLPPEVLDEEGFETLAELRPDGDDGLVLARRVSADGRSRAYAWGRSVARDEAGALAERLIAMSGQFEQRRLSRAAYQLDVLDAFAGDEQSRARAEMRRAWRELGAARRRHEQLAHGAAASEARRAELRALVEDAKGIAPGREEELRAERERLRHAEELAAAVGGAAAALVPDDGDGAAALAAVAARAVAGAVTVAPELERVVDDVRDAEVRLREAATELRSFLAALEGDPARLEHLEGELDRLADLRRRYRAATTEELLARAAEASSELAALDEDGDGVRAAERAVAAAQARVAELAERLGAGRAEAAPAFAAAVAAELRGLGMGGGEFRVELSARDPSPSGIDDVAFLIRPNRGLPYAPVAETASGGELSRVALAIASVAGGDTVVFDEIDAGIGGRTANAVASSLERLAERAQVVVITHLPQIASVAERHFRVEKTAGDPTLTAIQPLAGDERREELERMLGGREFLAQVR